MNAANDLLSAVAIIAAAAIIMFGLRQLNAFAARIRVLIAETHLLESRVVSELKHGAEEDPRDMELDSLAVSAPNLWPVWQRFRATLVRPGRGAFVASPQPVWNFFNGDLAYRSSIDLRAYESTPNRLIGAGLLVTFLCLAFSIWLARAGMGASLNETLGTIRDLLATVSVKFVSSIAAIGTSLWFSHRKDQLLRELDAALEELCASIEAILVPVSSDTIAEATLEELQQQTQLLEKGNGDLATAIARQIDETLRANLASALQPVADQIGKLGTRMGEMNQRALEYMVDRFSSALGEAAKAHTQEMTALLNEVSTSLTGLPDRLNDSSRAFVSVVDEVTSQFSKGVESSSSALGGMADEIKLLTGEIRKSEQALAGHLSKAESRIGSTIDRFSGFVEVLENAVTALAPLNDASRQLGDGSALLAEGAAGLRDVTARNVTSSERLADAVERYQRGLAGLDETLGATFARIEAGLQKLDGRAAGAASVINADLGTELGRLADAIQHLQLAVKLPRAIEALQ